MDERRTRRSNQPLEALSLFLDAARGRLGVEALTVATTNGKLLAGSGAEIDRVAALGAKVDSGKGGSSRVATWRLRVGRRDLVITSLGRRMTVDLGEAVRRILDRG